MLIQNSQLPAQKQDYMTRQTDNRRPLIDRSQTSLNISASQIDLNQTADPHFNNSIELTRSQLIKQRPATQLQESYLDTSARGLLRSQSQLDIQQTAKFKNQARKNIKENTKHLKGEICDLDDEIAQLQDHLLAQDQPTQQTSIAQASDLIHHVQMYCQSQGLNTLKKHPE